LKTFLALPALSATLSAQDFRATLSGQITDQSHAAIPGANVKATNLNNNGIQSVPPQLEMEKAFRR
jgi:hypothetical protein